MNGFSPLRAAIARLEGGKKWVQGGLYCKSDGARCILGAISNAQNNDESWDKLVDFTPQITAVATVIREQYPERVKGEDFEVSVVWKFNDADATEYSDVERVLEKAAILLEEEV